MVTCAWLVRNGRRQQGAIIVFVIIGNQRAYYFVSRKDRADYLPALHRLEAGAACTPLLLLYLLNIG